MLAESVAQQTELEKTQLEVVAERGVHLERMKRGTAVAAGRQEEQFHWPARTLPS